MPFLSQLVYDEIVIVPKKQNEIDLAGIYRIHASIREHFVKEKRMLMRLSGTRKKNLFFHGHHEHSHRLHGKCF